MHFTLVKIDPSTTAARSLPDCSDDVILPFYHALSRLGYTVEMRSNILNPQSVNILFGGSRIARELERLSLPANSIIFNLERMTSSSHINNKVFFEHLQRYTVWDYSRRNLRYFLKTLGTDNTAHVRLGYVPEMTRLARDYPKDIDVLFYGQHSAGRQKILEAVSHAKLRGHILQGVFGLEREHCIVRSKLVLNLPAGESVPLEVPRLGYLWANHKPVVCELDDATELDQDLQECCRFCRCDELLPATMEMALSGSAREAQAQKSFAAFSRLRQEDFLEAVVGRRAHAVLPRRPDWLHAGSGLDFRFDCLNVDINPAKNPDLVLDLSLPLDPQATYPTVRFGDIRLEPGSFTRITAFELLEHVRDLTRMMRNFLDLLCDGGELHISVPYDMSYGAWQDPTHVRAFNERSWIYYSSLAGYLGWREARFDVITLNCGSSGRKQSALIAKGVKEDDIPFIPRAIDGMNVILRKRASTEEEQLAYDRLTRNFYSGAVGDWCVR